MQTKLTGHSANDRFEQGKGEYTSIYAISLYCYDMYASDIDNEVLLHSILDSNMI